MIATDAQGPPRGHWLRVAFIAWVVGGLFTAQAVDALGSHLGAGFPCALCSLAWCEHRIVGYGLVHLAGLLLLWFAWSRAARATEVQGGRRPIVAASAPVVLAVATALERLVEVETVLGSGPVLGAIGTFLLVPAAPRAVRAMGWVCLLTFLVGYDVVVLGRLSPSEAEDPLFVVGLAGVGASIVVGVVARLQTARRVVIS